MALADEVQNRVATQKLINLTNPNDPDATAIDTTYLGYAVTDVEDGLFPMYAGLAYDNTDARHVAVAVQAVVYVLTAYKVPEGPFIERLRALVIGTKENPGLLRQLARVTARDRILPKSTSELTESDEKPVGVTTLRPDFDRDRFRGYVPRRPRAGAIDYRDEDARS